MQVLGIDLAGPANIEETSVVRFCASNGALSYVPETYKGSDSSIQSLAECLAELEPLVIGLDAPLSYQPGGGDRVRDSQLRRLIIDAGMRPGSVMAPTATRMVYLTLRGVTVAARLRGIQSKQTISVVEVHPGAAMGLRGAPLESVKTYKDSAHSRSQLLQWLASEGLSNLTGNSECSSHFVSACAAALAAWHWQRKSSVWISRAEEPWHPYDFSC